MRIGWQIRLWTLVGWGLRVVGKGHSDNAWNRSGPVLSRPVGLAFEQELSLRLSEPVGSQ